MSSDQHDCPYLDQEAFGCDVAGDQRLLNEGWTRRHLVNPQRAEESIELYGSMGFEVRAEKVTTQDFAPQCQQCALSICTSYVMIYTRKNNRA